MPHCGADLFSLQRAEGLLFYQVKKKIGSRRYLINNCRNLIDESSRPNHWCSMKGGGSND